jgi:hypothetical protein
MHGLTDAEARTVWSALALPGASERERLMGSQLPSSTYHATRRRSYGEGWVRDRYVPDPVAIGRPVVTFLLARPYAEEVGLVARRWAAMPGNVLLWMGTPMTLGVFFHDSPVTARRAVARLSDEERLRDLTSLTVDLHEARVPVYFDFEGAWARVAGVPVSGGYPFGLGFGASAAYGRGPRRPLPDRLRTATLELLARSNSTGDPGLIRWLGLGGLDRRQREVLDEGYLRPRTFLDPSKMPEYRGRRVDQVILISGEMRDRSDPTTILSELRAVHHASPFLFAYEGSKVLLGLLGHSGAPAPASPQGDAPSAPLGPVLRESLSRRLHRLDVFREEGSSLRTPVDHRYDGLLSPLVPAASPGVRSPPRASA